VIGARVKIGEKKIYNNDTVYTGIDGTQYYNPSRLLRRYKNQSLYSDVSYTWAVYAYTRCAQTN